MDNEPQYVSDAFVKFVKVYGIKHVTSSPTYPQSNGLAEKAVQTIKKMMTKCKEARDDIHLVLLKMMSGEVTHLASFYCTSILKSVYIVAGNARDCGT